MSDLTFPENAADTTEEMTETLYGKVPGTREEISNRLRAARIVSAGLTDFCSAFVAVGADRCRTNLVEGAAAVNAIMEKSPGTPSPLALMTEILHHLEVLSADGTFD